MKKDKNKCKNFKKTKHKNKKHLLLLIFKAQQRLVKLQIKPFLQFDYLQ